VSYDERRDEVYYKVTLSDGASFMVMVSATFSSGDWIEPEATDTIRERVGRAAAAGKANTDYRGPVLGPRP
jgi:hypothetical protein